MVIYSMIILFTWLGSIAIPFAWLSNQIEEPLDERDVKAYKAAMENTSIMSR